MVIEHGCMAATTLPVLFQPATFVACHAALRLLNKGKMLKLLISFLKQTFSVYSMSYVATILLSWSTVQVQHQLWILYV